MAPDDRADQDTEKKDGPGYPQHPAARAARRRRATPEDRVAHVAEEMDALGCPQHP